MFGKTIDQPRATAWFGPIPQDEDAAAAARDRTGEKQRELKPVSADPVLHDLHTRIEKFCRHELGADTKAVFNACLVNRYIGGSNSLGYHDDRERRLEADPWIASLSVGAVRKFKLKVRPEYEFAGDAWTPQNKGKEGAMDATVNKRRAGRNKNDTKKEEEQEQEGEGEDVNNNYLGTQRVHDLMLGPGDLLIMGTRVQHCYVHSVPKTRAKVVVKKKEKKKKVATTPTKFPTLETERGGQEAAEREDQEEEEATTTRYNLTFRKYLVGTTVPPHKKRDKVTAPAVGGGEDTNVTAMAPKTRQKRQLDGEERLDRE